MSEIPGNNASFSFTEWYNSYKKIIFYFSLILFVSLGTALGYGIAGSGIIEVITDVSKLVCDELKSILDLQDVWLERLVVVSPPIFLILAYNFYMAGKSSLLTKAGKASLGFVPIFATGAFYTFMFITSGVGIGVSTFGIMNFGPVFWIFVILSILITVLAIFIRDLTNDSFESEQEKERIRKRKRILTSASLSIALIIYLYSSLYIPYKRFKEYGALFNNANSCLILNAEKIK